jgi:hypothetical protein
MGMTSELNAELQHAIDAAGTSPVVVVDPRTNKTYVLVSSDQYERVQALFAPHDNLEETYAAQIESAMQAGWADPVMDDYNHYDERRK